MRESWEPLVEGTDRDRALEIATAIATSIRDIRPEWQPGLMGATGVGVFLAYAEAAGLGVDLGATELLEHGLTGLAAQDHDIGLWTGVAGVRWAVSHLITPDDAMPILARLDRAIMVRLASPELEGHDLWSGLAGVLLAYADDAEYGDQVLSCTLDYVVHIDLFGCAPRDVGCAHGIAGLLGALACCLSRGRHDSRIEPLMLAMIRSLESADVSEQRVGWCRGEAGLAVAVLGAACVLGRNDLRSRAIEIALASFAGNSRRWPRDAGLCHGAAGLTHLYNRMYQATADERLRDHARTWLHNTMAMQTPGQGIAGYSMLRRRSELTWEPDPSLLVGAAGVGLAMIASATPIVPSWDRIICADISGTGTPLRSTGNPDGQSTM